MSMFIAFGPKFYIFLKKEQGYRVSYRGDIPPAFMQVLVGVHSWQFYILTAIGY